MSGVISGSTKKRVNWFPISRFHELSTTTTPPNMPQSGDAARGMIAQYRYVDNLAWTEISRRIPAVTPDGARKFIKHLEMSYPHASTKELIELAAQKKPRGSNQRVKPGSKASIAIRDALS